uniref:Craniofacial development protein 2 n=1 Tax=Cacopsylla melanoneura TaxID=428564 RepID=A0A8D8VT20_9HEMI
MACTNNNLLLPQVSRGSPVESHPDIMSGRGPSESGEGQYTLSSRIRNETRPPRKKKTKTTNMNIATWNVKTLLDSSRKESSTIPRKTAIVAREMEKLNIDIAALQETHLKGFGRLDERKAGYTYFWSGCEESSERNDHGVAICIKTSLIRKGIISEPTCIDERIMTIDIIEEGTKTVFICCYAPTNVDTDAAKDYFYDTLSNILRNTPRSHSIILAGDFNARVGRNNITWNGVIGKHGVGRQNENGLRLLQLSALEELTITSTWFQQKDKYKNTWKHPRSRTWHMIDYIIVRQAQRSNVKKCRTMRSAQCETDHHLVRAKIAVKPKIVQNKRQGPVYYDSRCLKDEAICTNFEESVRNHTGNITEQTNVEFMWNAFKDTITKAAAETMQKKKPNLADWFDESDIEIKKLLELKKKAYEKFLSAPSKENEKELKSIKKSCQSKIRKIRDNWWSKRAEQLQKYIEY